MGNILVDKNEYEKYKKVYESLINAFDNDYVIVDCINVRSDELYKTLFDIDDLVEKFND